MIPYVEIAPFHIAKGFVVQPFGVAVALGVCAGFGYCAFRARQRGIPAAHGMKALWWAIASGFVAAHITAVLLYQPESLVEHGLSALLDTSTGLS